MARRSSSKFLRGGYPNWENALIQELNTNEKLPQTDLLAQKFICLEERTNECTRLQ